MNQKTKKSSKKTARKISRKRSRAKQSKSSAQKVEVEPAEASSPEEYSSQAITEQSSFQNIDTENALSAEQTSAESAEEQQFLKIEELLNMMEDLEEEKRKSEESEEKYKELFNSSQDAIMTLAPPHWKFTSGNPATVKMFRCKDEKEFVSLGPWQLSPKKQPDGQLSSDKAKKMIMKAMKEGSNFFEWTHKKYQGKDFPVTVLLSRMGKKGDYFLQATVRAITEQKKIEDKLLLVEKKYQQEIKHLKEQIKKLKKLKKK